MAKELPYFRFVVQEWQNGDISIESYELKGLFIDVCGFYWIKDCSVSIAMLYKRFSNARLLLEQLIDTTIIKLNNDESICIEFLDEQFDLLSEKRKKRQLAGQKGGLTKSSNAKAMPQQSSSYKDKDKDKEKDNNKAFLIDVEKDEREYRETLFKVIAEKKISRDVLFKNNRIDLSKRVPLWESFVKNSMVEIPRFEDDKHIWNAFKKFIKDNSSNFQIKRDRNPQ